MSFKLHCFSMLVSLRNVVESTFMFEDIDHLRVVVSNGTLPTKVAPSTHISWIKLIGINAVVAGLEIAASVAFTFIPPLLLKIGYGETQMSIIFGIGENRIHKACSNCFNQTEGFFGWLTFSSTFGLAHSSFAWKILRYVPIRLGTKKAIDFWHVHSFGGGSHFVGNRSISTLPIDNQVFRVRKEDSLEKLNCHFWGVMW